MTTQLKSAVASLFKITKEIRRIDFKITLGDTETDSLLQRKRLVKALESKSSLLEVALAQVKYIKNNLCDCLGLKVCQIDMILHLVNTCDTMAVEHIRQITDLETLVC
mmetsp:Transcript_18623/g.33662  ORF Transcript_18623/g.33662 Transcript_18623/m.33662 type:complete len:108 (+) Transcript_18623:1422-1745(+)